MGKRKGDSYGEEKEKIPKLEERPLAEFSKICRKISDDKLDVEILRKFLDELEENKDNDSTLSLIRSSFDDKLIISLLSTYSVTRSEQDELVFTILQKAERVYQVELSKYFPIIWGQNAKKNYENLQKFGTSLHVRITPNEVFLKIKMISLPKILIFFPVISNLNPVHLWLSAKNQHRTPQDPKLYDSNFLLRLFYNLLQPGSEVSCELFAKTNCLAFVFTCCSSPHSTTRVLAYYCLQRYLGLVTTLQASPIAEIFEERTFLIYVLKLFRQSVEIEAQRLSNIITHFFARTVDLLFHAGENPITNAIIAFLCLKPVVDFNNVPEFYKLLFSSSTEHHKEEQNWILMLISEALIEPMDYNLLQNRNGLKLLQGVFTSSMTDQTSRKHILSILKSCVQMPTLANELFTKINLPTWICTAIKVS
ncbi:hypothetical protein WR25_03909 [Diploscapter pachys]|uniref:URB1 C-terminal domain-containing protein n=1 Tax=Diploscapter pachys TaxID=2018661 RepID=A0A2A2KK40_9BILA|nr:hypothetical protein WR25_03909 [Diploscapter pachys]